MNYANWFIFQCGYQITQQRAPLAVNGILEFQVYNPSVHKKPYASKAKIKQVQLEQDSGKSLHDNDRSLVDLNRAGVPLMELVFEPDLKDGEEAAALVKELIAILQRIRTCSCKMEGKYSWLSIIQIIMGVESTREYKHWLLILCQMLPTFPSMKSHPTECLVALFHAFNSMILRLHVEPWGKIRHFTHLVYSILLLIFLNFEWPHNWFYLRFYSISSVSRIFITRQLPNTAHHCSLMFIWFL